MSSTYDVVIIGGGAAGLSGALALGRSRRRVAVVDAGQPRNAPAAHMQGYLSCDGLPPSELLAIGREEVRAYGVELLADTVVGVSRDPHAGPGEPAFVVQLATGAPLRARRLLVTTGVVDELPDIAGLRERWGRDVLHCPYCHGWEVRDRPLGVLGTIPGSVLHAHLVRQWSDDIVFFAHTYPLTADERAGLVARGIAVADGPVAQLVVEADRVVAVELADGTRVPRSAVFLRPGIAARPDAPLARLGCATDHAGLPAVDASGRTSVPGVWAAGNVVDPRGQVVAAAGAANTAAIAINADLVAEDVALAVSRT